MNINSTKAIVALAAVACALAVLPNAEAGAVSLPIGSTVSPLPLLPNGADLVGGRVVVDLLNQPYSTPHLQGTLSSWVLANTAENPGGYTFVYQINNAADSDPVTGVGTGTLLGNTLGFLSSPSSTISVGNNISGGSGLRDLVGTTPAYSATWSSGPGSAISFAFMNEGVVGGTTYTTVAPGTSSSYLVVETDATSWTASTAGITGSPAATANDLLPNVVPDGGATLMLLAAALSALAFLRRKVVLVAAACALAVLPSAQAGVIPAPPGGTLTPNNASLTGGVLVPGGTLLNEPYTSSTLNGTISTWILENTLEDPIGYTFVYQITHQ